MASGRLNESGQVILDGTGAGTVKLGPISAREVWNPDTASVKTNQAPGTVVNEATVNLYVGNAASQQYFRDLTFTGSSGDVSDKVAGDLKCGSYIFAVWTGGDAGVQAMLMVSGTKEI